MKPSADNIHKALKEISGVDYDVVEEHTSNIVTRKTYFIDAINTLIDLEDRAVKMIEDTGVDLSSYDNMYYKLIDIMFEMIFTDEQISLIETYLYELRFEEGWDGLIYVGEEKEGKPFKTPEDVWKVVDSLENQDK